MITCGRCQTQNLDGSQFCDECGAPLHPSSVTSLRSTGLDAKTGAFRLPVESDEATVVRPDRPPPPQIAPMTPPEPIPVAPVPLPPPGQATPGVFEMARPPRNYATGAYSGVQAPGAANANLTPAPASSGSSTTHAKLVIERGRSAGKQFPINGDEAYIGRWDADGGIFPDVDLDADDPEAKVSRRHARIVRHNGQYFLEDLGSTNGTFINRGRRLLPGDRHPLGDGDELIVGKMFLRFYLVKN